MQSNFLFKPICPSSTSFALHLFVSKLHCLLKRTPVSSLNTKTFHIHSLSNGIVHLLSLCAVRFQQTTHSFNVFKHSIPFAASQTPKLYQNEIILSRFLRYHVLRFILSCLFMRFFMFFSILSPTILVKQIWILGLCQRKCMEHAWLVHMSLPYLSAHEKAKFFLGVFCFHSWFSLRLGDLNRSTE